MQSTSSTVAASLNHDSSTSVKEIMQNDGPRLRENGSRDPGPPDDFGRIEASETFRTLVDAINQQTVLLVRFKAETEPRVICPDRIGIHPHDQYQVEAFQLRGPSSRGERIFAWKCFHLHDLKIVGTEPEGWTIGPRL